MLYSSQIEAMAALYTAIFLGGFAGTQTQEEDKSPCDLIPTSGTCNKVCLAQPKANFRETFQTFCQIPFPTCLVADVIFVHLKSLGLVVEFGGLLLGFLQTDLGIPGSLQIWMSGS